MLLSNSRERCCSVLQFTSVSSRDYAGVVHFSRIWICVCTRNHAISMQEGLWALQGSHYASEQCMHVSTGIKATQAFYPHSHLHERHNIK